MRDASVLAMLSACDEDPCQEEHISERTVRPAITFGALPDMLQNRFGTASMLFQPTVFAQFPMTGTDRGVQLHKRKKLVLLRLMQTAAVRETNKKLDEIQLSRPPRRPFDHLLSPILKSSILRPVFMAATNQRGCFPRPDHVSDASEDCDISEKPLGICVGPYH